MGGGEGRGDEGGAYSQEILTLGSSRHASTPGLRFLRSEKTPSSNFFMLRTGRPKASKRKTSARTISVPVMW